MRIHCIQHISHENPGSIKTWCHLNKFPISYTRTYLGDEFPSVSDLDWLVVLGGPMGTADDHHYPWLKKEKIFIENVIKQKKKIWGICLGAQLIAEVLGAKVYKNDIPELGWLPVNFTDFANNSGLFSNFAQKEYVFQWHNDTFDLPKGAKKIAESEACKNQAFLYGSYILGLQFHLEFTPEIVKELIHSSNDEFSQANQKQKEILTSHHFNHSHSLMSGLLDNFSRLI